MDGSASRLSMQLQSLCLIYLCLISSLTRNISDFTIWSPVLFHKLLPNPSNLALRFSINGDGERDVPGTRRDTEGEIWEVDGDVTM